MTPGVWYADTPRDQIGAICEGIVAFAGRDSHIEWHSLDEGWRMVVVKRIKSEHLTLDRIVYYSEGATCKDAANALLRRLWAK